MTLSCRMLLMMRWLGAHTVSAETTEEVVDGWVKVRRTGRTRIHFRRFSIPWFRVPSGV